MKQRVMMLFLFLMVLLTGCSGEHQASDTEHTYKIYYLNSSMTRLAPQDYVTETTDTDALIGEIWNQFVTVPQDLDSQAALSDKVALTKYQREEMVLYLYFDAGYGSRSNMNTTREILCRAALAKTMTQIEGIDYINIYVGDQPLLDKAGNPVGMMSGGDFVESISDVNAFEKTELVLYFADETGESLVEEQREVVHNVNTSLEKLIIEELIKGPEEPGRKRTLPKDTKLLNVSVNENVCYINFDSAFLNNTEEVMDTIPIYSIVNSLSGLTSVNKVQITINGSTDVMFRDSISLNTMFERNLDIGGTDN